MIERNALFTRGCRNHIHPPKIGASTILKIQADVRVKAEEDVFNPAGGVV